MVATSIVDIDIDKAALFEQLGYTPHSPAQHEAHFSTARFKVPCCGRRWGKTTWAAKEMEAALFKPDAWYWIVGPNYRLGEKEFRIIYRDLMNKLKLGKHIKASYNMKQGDMKIELPWNTVLEVMSAERKEGLVGEGLDGVIMSEAAKHSRDIWEMYIRPALADKHGFALFPSTPQGYNWYHGLYKLGKELSMPDFQSWRFPSWSNPIVFPGGRNDPEILDIEKAASKVYFEQEIAALFTSFEGKIYDEWDPDAHIISIDYNSQWKNFWAFDFGFSAPFVCLDIMVDPSDNVYVWREYQVKHKSTMDHGHVLKERPNPQGFHVDSMFGDPRGADEIATLGTILGAVWGRPVPWTHGIEAVKRHLKKQPGGKPRLFIDRSCVDLIRQMDSLRTPIQKHTDREAKEGQHDYDDHGPDALRYFFSEYFILGANSHLSDVYDPTYLGSESESFFKLHTGVTVGESPIWYK